MLRTLKPGKGTMYTTQALELYSLIPFICTKSCSAQWRLVGGVVQELVIEQHASAQAPVRLTHHALMLIIQQLPSL